MFFSFFTDENVNNLSISDNTEIINHDYSNIGVSTLHKKLMKSRRIIRKNQNIITLQKRQNQRLRTRITCLKKTITDLEHQREVSIN